MRVKVISRSTDDFTRARSQDLQKVFRNYDPALRTQEKAVEYTRALNAAKLEKIFAKPFIGAMDGHIDAVSCMAKNPNYLKAIFSGSMDGDIRLWDIAARKTVCQFPGHQGAVRGLATSTNGDLLISCGVDCTVRLWKVPMLKMVDTNDAIGDASQPSAVYTWKHAFWGVDHQWDGNLFATVGAQVDIWDHNRSEPIIGGGSFFSGMVGLGARLDEVSRRRGTVTQEHFGNSASLSKGPPGLWLNGVGELDGQEFEPSRVHSVGAIPNHSTFDMGSAWTETKTDDSEFHRHIQNHFASNMGKMNAFRRRDLDSTYLSDSDLSDALSGLRLSNRTALDERSHEKELLDEILRHRRDFSSKIADGSRPPLAGNVYRTPRSERWDICALPIYEDGVLHRQNSSRDDVSRMNRHHMKNVDHQSVAEQISLMQLGNLHGEANRLRNAPMINMINPLNNRQNTITDLDFARNRNALLEDLFAQQGLQNDNLFLPKSGLSYNDNKLYHDDAHFPYSRMQRSESNSHKKLGSIPCQGDQQSLLFSFSRRAAGRNTGLQFYQDNPVANYLDSLDIANRNSAGSLELVDVVGRVMEVSMDQYGSRFIQQKLEDASADERNKIFPEILSNAIALTTDVFGNYVIQKFFEFATESQLSQLADQLKGHILELSFQMYGCRVVQKVLEVVDMDRKINIVHELKNSVLRCIADRNGNHVIQKCIECVPQDRVPFIIEAILKQFFVLCTHQYGCRVIQRVLEHCHDPATQSAVMDEIVQHACHLTEDKFGNYVVQHVLQHGKPEERSSIIQKLSGQVAILSQQKYASNVVEKCLTFGTPEERDGLIMGIVSSGQTFQGLVKDQFGNYVVQRVLQTCDDKYLEMILSSIKVHLNELKNYTYGKHIVARIEKLIITGENRVRMVSKACQCQQSPNCTDVDVNPF